MEEKLVYPQLVDTAKPQPAAFSAVMLQMISELQAGKKYAACHTHGSTFRSFLLFAEERGKGGGMLLFDDVFTVGMLKEYQEWLLLRNASLNTVSTYMRRLLATYNRKYAECGSVYNPHLFDGLHMQVVSNTKRALRLEEADVVTSASPASLPVYLRRAWAYFTLLFFLRGMPFIDLAYLRKKDCKGDILTYCRHKTGKVLTVRIPPAARQLFEECRDRTSSPYLFPILNGRLHDDRAIYHCYECALRRFNKQLGTLGKLLGLSTRLSSYTARHTWATLAFYNHIPVGIISQALGHSSVKVTETYLKPFENKKLDDANEKLTGLVAAPRISANVLVCAVF